MKKIAHRVTYFFEDKPLFGMDIGHDMLRVMQLDIGRKVPRVKGYGSIAFDPSAISKGVIVKPELIAKATANLFRKELVGDIGTRRVAVSLPVRWALTRAVQLPKMTAKDMDEAVRTEMEQYFPLSADNLYLDYTTLRQSDEGSEVFVVAMPQKIVDSYLALTKLLGLEAVLFDTATGAAARLFARDRDSSIPSVLIDFGSTTTDITVFNHGLLVTGTVAFGGDDITKVIANATQVNSREAVVIKSEYGIAASDFQKQIAPALASSLELLLKEVRRTIRYYEQRYSKEPPIGQIVTMGGGANTPGLADFLTDHLRLPARTISLRNQIDFGHLRPIYSADLMTFVTSAGLALTDPAEVFA
ncbi:MAG TPA: pilus assembly protein PilM [Candidatus Saccharimonadales bacterium]|nr:pilus assembly protein PilM [Candidatus Saccharimonadales bacterium]